MHKILVLDNYDSFTYNLVHYVQQLHSGELTVARNDKIALDQVDDFDGIILSPGPGLPNEAGIMPELVKRYAPSKKILGVCLGHQCIGEVFGGKLLNLSVPVHGKATSTRITEPGDPLFRDIPEELQTGRYHSWVVERSSLPDCLTVTAEDEAGLIMAIRHRAFDVCGVQFHPESILTEHGLTMMRNWLAE